MNAIRWTTGYTAAEIERAQTRFRLTFPPDLVELLRDRRPVGGPDWNNEETVRPLLAWPFEGLLFDIENNGLWWAEWGNRPNAAEERTEVLAQVLSRAPKLIPIFGHRYLPATPTQAGNPVFSVYQSDVIYCGANLAHYLDAEEYGLESHSWPEVREIDFWSELVRRNGDPCAYYR